MTRTNEDNEYRNDALYVTEDTTIDEIVDFLRSSIENPIIIGENGENIVWNFSTHEVDRSILDVEGKDCDRFIIPYQVTGTWGFMYQLLPEQLKSAELLVYRQDAGEYYAYRNFYRTTQNERQSGIRQDLARRLERTSIPEVME